MAVNHTLNVRLLGGSGRNSRTSSVGTLRRNNKKKDNGNQVIPTIIRASRTVRTQDISGSIGLFGGGGGSFGMTMALLQEASKVHDLWLDYKTAISGETVYAGNVKKVKSYVLSLGSGYLRDTFQNNLMTKNIVNRQNIQQQYYRNLYFERYEGNQYKSKG